MTQPTTSPLPPTVATASGKSTPADGRAFAAAIRQSLIAAHPA